MVGCVFWILSNRSGLRLPLSDLVQTLGFAPFNPGSPMWLNKSIILRFLRFRKAVFFFKPFRKHPLVERMFRPRETSKPSMVLSQSWNQKKPYQNMTKKWPSWGWFVGFPFLESDFFDQNKKCCNFAYMHLMYMGMYIIHTCMLIFIYRGWLVNLWWNHLTDLLRSHAESWSAPGRHFFTSKRRSTSSARGGDWDWGSCKIGWRYPKFQGRKFGKLIDSVLSKFWVSSWFGKNRYTYILDVLAKSKISLKDAK